LQLSNGDTYDGCFKNDKKEGFGIFKTLSGEVYEGEFKNDGMEGKGIYKDNEPPKPARTASGLTRCR
jgi:hypothetical protein